MYNLILHYGKLCGIFTWTSWKILMLNRCFCFSYMKFCQVSCVRPLPSIIVFIKGIVCISLCLFCIYWNLYQYLPVISCYLISNNLGTFVDISGEFKMQYTSYCFIWSIFHRQPTWKFIVYFIIILHGKICLVCSDWICSVCQVCRWSIRGFSKRSLHDYVTCDFTFLHRSTMV